MPSVNDVKIIGYLTTDLEVRNVGNGSSVTDLNIQVRSRFQKDDGTEGMATSFHTVTVWGQTASFLGQYARRGSQVYVSGRIKTDSWEDDQGNKKYKTKIVADPYRGVELLDPRTPLSPLDDSFSVAGGLNQATVIGNVTKDLEIRQTPSGNNVVNFSIATNRRWKDRDSGEMQEETEFHNIVAWGRLAEDAEKILKKGQAILVIGPLINRSWETPTGEKRYTTEVRAEQLLALGHPATELADALGSQSADSSDSEKNPSPRQEKSSSMPQNANTDTSIPTINYESEIKPEDLPF